MIAIKDGNKTKYFANQADADNYNDYLQNGLKVIRTDSRTYYFNNGYRLMYVSMQGEQKSVTCYILDIEPLQAKNCRKNTLRQ